MNVEMAGNLHPDPFVSLWSRLQTPKKFQMLPRFECPRNQVLCKMAADNLGVASKLTEVKEGKAVVLFPDSESVFYNPVQEFNRDLSVLVIKEFINLYDTDRRSKPASKGPKTKQKFSSGEECAGEEFKDPEPSVGQGSSMKLDGEHKDANIRILEGLAATGLRSIRYALEIEGIARIIANDLSKVAVENIKRNIAYNKVEDIVEGSWSDAGLLMYQNKFPNFKRFQIIDIDPYGSPAMFLDGAVQAIDDGGLLCITCTDMAGLCGNHGEASFAKYGAMPLKSKCCHEMALRLVLGSIDSHAGRYKRHITPLLSVSADFYIRVFLRVHTSASEVKRSASKKSYIFQCVGCDSFHLQPVGKKTEEGNKRKYNAANGPIVGETCQECGHRFQIGGPIWSEPMHEKTFVEGLLKRLNEESKSFGTSQRLTGTLTVISEELDDCPLYYVIDKLANVIHCSVPSMLQFRSAIIRLGYKVSSTHANSNGVKTNAPNSVIWDILRCWEKLHPVKEQKKTGLSPAAAILSKSPKINVSFEILEEANPMSRKMRISRFPENPEPDWGPKARAKGTSTFPTLAEKRKQLQGKKTKRNEEEIAAKVKQFPCKRFKLGTCELSADECRYSHNDSVANKNSDTEAMAEAANDRQTVVINDAQMMNVS